MMLNVDSKIANMRFEHIVQPLFKDMSFWCPFLTPLPLRCRCLIEMSK